MERVDHAAAATRLIDQCLAEEGEKLDELKQIVEQNGTELSAEDLVFGWFSNRQEAGGI